MMINKIKRNYLKQRGITLIALVVTIVVLLILAGVSINALFGQDGIILRAKDTKKVTNLSSLKEEIGIVIQSRNINKMAGLPVGSFKEELENGISGNKTVEAIGNIGDTCYVTREEATLTVYDNGDIIDGKADIWDGTSKSKPTADESKNWHIYTPEEMKYFEEFVNGKLTDEEKEGLEITDSTIVYLENDIDMGARQENGVLTAGTAWDPIGKDDTRKFIGTFEGNNHTVKGIYVKKDGNFAGLFGISDTIQNLTVADSYIEVTGKRAGGIVGALREGNIVNCHNVNTRVSSSENGNNVGGIVGQFGTQNFAEGNIINCTNTGNVESNGHSIGGTAGLFAGKKIENCVNEGKVNGGIENGYGMVAGIVGNAITGDIVNCTNKGVITDRGISTGGISGQFQGGEIQFCINIGTIYGGIYNDINTYSGGIVGQFLGKMIESCVNNGNTLSKGTVNGGICGVIAGNASITKCINTGNIQGKANYQAGIAASLGSNSSVTVEKCINTGTIQGTGNYQGGICGVIGDNSSAIIKNCYSLGDVIEETSNVAEIGGIIATINKGFSGTISNNYNLGRIIIKGQNVKDIGGVIGYLSTATTESATIKNNYYKQGIVENADNNNYGESKTETEMKTEEFLALLNADQETPVWELNPSKNNGYPSLIGVDK